VQLLKRRNPVIARPRSSVIGVSGNSESKDEIMRNKLIHLNLLNRRISQISPSEMAQLQALQLEAAIEEKKEEQEDSLDKELEQIDKRGTIERQERSVLDQSGLPKKSMTIKDIEEGDSSKPAEPVAEEEHHSDEEDEDMPMESNISKNLSDRTIKIVIILVLLMLFILPLFSIDLYIATPTMHD
jgi:hypothetical protein